jgi:hypothetical protein
VDYDTSAFLDSPHSFSGSSGYDMY